jgi:hypothetical protein
MGLWIISSGQTCAEWCDGRASGFCLEASPFVLGSAAPDNPQRNGELRPDDARP